VTRGRLVMKLNMDNSTSLHMFTSVFYLLVYGNIFMSLAMF
jgi:hypothetical protein